MSNETPKPQQSDEVDLGQLFKLIGNTFDRFFNFIGSIFKRVFSVFIYSLKAIIINFKIISIVIFVAFILGFGLEKLQPKTYRSTMLVKPYFESKYQLLTNIDYYNTLIGDRDYEKLKDIFGIDIESARQLVEFEVEPGMISEFELMLEYDEFLSSLDSSSTLDVSFKEFVDSRTLQSSNVFEISVVSKKKDIFKVLESGLNKTFTSTHSSKKRDERDSLIALDKKRIVKSLEQIDSLKIVYIDVLKKESNSKDKGSISIREGMSLIQERVKTKEFELLQKELELRQELNNIESGRVGKDVFFDTLSSFQDLGRNYKSIWKRYSIIFPLLAFILLITGYLLRKTIVFVKNYEE